MKPKTFEYLAEMATHVNKLEKSRNDANKFLPTVDMKSSAFPLVKKKPSWLFYQQKAHHHEKEKMK